METLNVDLVERIAERLAASRDIDDAVRDAAALAMACNRATAAMSAALWTAIVRRAERMRPDPLAESLASHCSDKTYDRVALVKLALACGLPRVSRTSMQAIEGALERSDESVSRHCPIPRAAALYLLHMAWRRMPIHNALVVFQDRVLTGFAGHRIRDGIRYRSLRAAPKKLAAQDRRATLKLLDALFAPERRPWWVRTEAQAREHFVCASLHAAGYPTWLRDVTEAADFRDACVCLGEAMAEHRGWESLRRAAVARLPEAFRRCSDLLPDAFAADDVRVLFAEVGDAHDTIADVPHARRREVERYFWSERARYAMPTVALMARAILFDWLDLPIAAVFWTPARQRHVRDVQQVSRALSIGVCRCGKCFARAVNRHVRSSFACPDAEPTNGWFFTMADIVGLAARAPVPFPRDDAA